MCKLCRMPVVGQLEKLIRQKNRGLIAARVICQANDRGQVRDPVGAKAIRFLMVTLALLLRPSSLNVIAARLDHWPRS